MLKRKRYLWKFVYVFVICFFCGQLLGKWRENVKQQGIDVHRKVAETVFHIVLEQSTPIMAFMENAEIPDWTKIVWKQLNPALMCLKPEEVEKDWVQSKFIYEEMIAEPETEVFWEELQREEETQVMEELVTQEIEEEQTEQDFIPAKEKSVSYTIEQLHDPTFLKETFYTVDPTTQISDAQLSYEKLVGYDASIEKRTDGKPQILIYHTHSQETYADSVAGDAGTSVVGVGERLTELLRDKYGYTVLHHTGEYDKESRDYAYSYAAKGLQQVLEENPTIEVIIDLHRDAVKEETHLVTPLQGKNMAKFMFFNGMSYTNAVGELKSLPNPYIQENISFAFQLKLAAEEYYPGLTRKTYLKGYRYNMQYRPKSLLIEVGAQNNTVEGAMNAVEPLAHILSMVLSGKNRQ